METIMYSPRWKCELVWTLLLLSAMLHAALFSIMLRRLGSEHVLTPRIVAIATIQEVLLPQSFRQHKPIITVNILMLGMVPSCPPNHELVGIALSMPRWVTSASLFSLQIFCFRNHFTHVHSYSFLLELQGHWLSYFSWSNKCTHLSFSHW